MAGLQPLYNIQRDQSASRLNQTAHPGGGTRTIQVRSGEGLVEDGFEAQLRALEIAYRQPTVRVLADLAGSLDGLRVEGRSELADLVDGVLVRVAAPPASPTVPTDDVSATNPSKAYLLQHALLLARDSFALLDKASYLGTAEHTSAYRSAKATLTSVVAALEEADLSTASTYIQELANGESEMWKGTWYGKVGLDNLSWPDNSKMDFKVSIKKILDMIKKIDSAPGELVPGAHGEALHRKEGPGEVIQAQLETLMDSIKQKSSDVEALYSASKEQISDPQKRAQFDQTVGEYMSSTGHIIDSFGPLEEKIRANPSANYLGYLKQVSYTLDQVAGYIKETTRRLNG